MTSVTIWLLWPNLVPLQRISLQSRLHDLDLDLSWSLKIKSSGIVELPVYEFLLVSNNNHMSTSHHLALTGILLGLFSLGQNFRPELGVGFNHGYIQSWCMTTPGISIAVTKIPFCTFNLLSLSHSLSALLSNKVYMYIIPKHTI